MRLALPAILMVLAAPVQAEPTITTSRGMVRVLDKVNGTVRDLTLSSGTSEAVGHLTITMGECRYPRDNPTGDAFIQLVIQDMREAEPVFSGWMVASEHALEPRERAEAVLAGHDRPSSAT